ncbi:MAG: recombinase family protein [Bacilli bacterium]|nr:recombinase family protein [Bacilli bacterium]
MIKEYCEKNDYSIVDIYNDAGHSGKDLLRTEMQRLIKDIKDIEKAIKKLKLQEKKLVDLYLTSNLNVDVINHKNEVIKNEIEKLGRKKEILDTNDEVIFPNHLGLTFIFDSLNRKAKQKLIAKLISSLEITREYQKEHFKRLL